MEANSASAILTPVGYSCSTVNTESTCSISIFLRELRMISGHRKLFQARRNAMMVMVPMMAGLIFGTTTCQ